VTPRRRGSQSRAAGPPGKPEVASAVPPGTPRRRSAGPPVHQSGPAGRRKPGQTTRGAADDHYRRS
jgi:hypothetical protein